MPEDDEIPFVSFDDIEDESDEFGFVPFEPENKQELENELLPLFSRQGKNGSTELTNFPEEIQQQEEPDQFQQINPEQQMVQESQQQEVPEHGMHQEDQFPLEGENDLEREIERGIAQQTSRQAESILGMPGDVNSIVEGITGLPLFGLLGHFAPTSEKLKDVSEKATLGYTKPQNEFEESIGELQQDIASFMIPGSKQYSMLRNIGIPLAANLAKEGVKLTGEEKVAEGTKMGLMVVLDLWSQRQGGAKKFYQGLFEEMHKRVPKGRTYSAENLEPALKSLIKEFELGGDKPSVTKAVAKSKEILGKIKNGKISLEEAVAIRPAINEMVEDLQGFEYIFKPKMKEKIIANLHKVKSEVIKSAEEYGKKIDPKFLELSRTANEAAAAYQQSNMISKFLNKNFGAKALSKPVQFILGISGIGGGALKAGAYYTAGAALPIAGAYQTVKMFSRLKKSPTLRKYYGSVLDAAAKGNVGQASRGIKAIEKEFKDEDFIEFED
jgi:hypothetical protein